MKTRRKEKPANSPHNITLQCTGVDRMEKEEIMNVFGKQMIPFGTFWMYDSLILELLIEKKRMKKIRPSHLFRME